MDGLIYLFLITLLFYNCEKFLIQQAHVIELGTFGRAMYHALPGKVIRHLQIIKPMASLLIDGVCSDLFSLRFNTQYYKTNDIVIT